MNLILLQIILLAISLIASCSFLFIVIMIGIKNKMNQLFSLYMFFQICWLISSIGLRFTIVHNNISSWNNSILNSTLWLTFAGFSLIIMTLYLYRFSCFFTDKNNRLCNSIFIILNLSVIFLVIVHLHIPLFYNPDMNLYGHMTIDYHWLGLTVSIFFNLLWLSSLINLWKVRHIHGIIYLMVSILIYGIGIILGATRLIKFPTMPIAVLLSNILLGYVIINKRIISPLREKSLQLEHEILKRITLEKNLHSIRKDRSILINEVHHRVRNNMQLISSLAHFHSRYLHQYDTQAILNRFQDLMHSMAFIHNHIYEENDLTKINFSDFIKDLITNIRMTNVYNDKFSIQQNIKEVYISFEQALPCGIILHELLSNIFKHAFPVTYKNKPIVNITFQIIKSDTYEIVVKDNGIGLPKNFDLNNIDTIGLKLVKILIENQLNGNIEMINSKGTAFRLLFKIENKSIQDV